MTLFIWLVILMVIFSVVAIIEGAKKRRQRRIDRAAAQIIRDRSRRYAIG